LRDLNQHGVVEVHVQQHDELVRVSAFDVQ
jgi:hypothetical protein